MSYDPAREPELCNQCKEELTTDPRGWCLECVYDPGMKRFRSEMTVEETKKEKFRKELDDLFDQAILQVERQLAPDDERRQPILIRKMACCAAIDHFISEKNRDYFLGAPPEALQVCAELMTRIKEEETTV
jgi:hypothetical protein